MKKLLVLLTLITVVFSGCSLLQREPTPKEVVSTAFDNLKNFDSFGYKMNLAADVTAQDQSVKFNIAYSGQQDVSDKAKPKFSMKVNLGLSVPQFSDQSVSGELKSDGDNLYFVLNSISDFGDDSIVEMVTPFLGKWYSVNLQDQGLEGLNPMVTLQSGDEENMTEEQKKLLKLYNDTQFLTDVKFSKTDGDYDVYTAKLDKAATYKFLQDIALLNGEELVDNNEEVFNNTMKAVDVDVVLYVDRVNNVLSKVTSTLTIDNYEQDGETIDGKVDFSLEFSNIGEPVTIEAPAEFEVFDPSALFASMYGIDPSAMDPSMMDSSMMDSSAMEDYQTPLK